MMAFSSMLLSIARTDVPSAPSTETRSPLAAVGAEDDVRRQPYILLVFRLDSLVILALDPMKNVMPRTKSSTNGPIVTILIKYDRSKNTIRHTIWFLSDVEEEGAITAQFRLVNVTFEVISHTVPRLIFQQSVGRHK